VAPLQPRGSRYSIENTKGNLCINEPRVSPHSNLKLHTYKVQDVVSKYDHVSENPLATTSQSNLITKNYRRSQQRSKTRSLSREDREDKYVESHLMPFLLDKIVASIMEEAV
jgi:hypothetical protein